MCLEENRLCGEETTVAAMMLELVTFLCIKPWLLLQLSFCLGKSSFGSLF